jgi:hypothetical protein
MRAKSITPVIEWDTWLAESKRRRRIVKLFDFRVRAVDIDFPLDRIN